MIQYDKKVQSSFINSSKENVEVKEIPDAFIPNVQIKMTGESEKTLSVANLIDLNRISTLPKLLRITGLFYWPKTYLSWNYTLLNS